MNVGNLIKKLSALDPETLVVKFHENEGYDECFFVEGTFQTEGHVHREVLKENRAKRVKGQPRPDFLHALEGQTRAKTFQFVVIN